MKSESMASGLTNTGISAIGEVPWGTHFCYFYETKQDLLEAQVLYFKTGLERNEFCLWVISQALSVEEARHALAQAVPDLESHLAHGALEIHRHDDWYLRDGRWDPQRVLQSWREKLEQTPANGYVGCRAAGDGGWIQNDDWMVFREYEEQVNVMLRNQQSIILCTYPLTTIPGDQVFEVAHIHEVAVARRNGTWEVLETPELKQAKAEIKRLNDALEHKVDERTHELATTNEALRSEIAERKRAEMQAQMLIDAIPHQIWSGTADGTIDYCNDRWRWDMGLELEDLQGDGWQSMLHPDDRDRVLKAWHESVVNGTPYEQEERHREANGRYRWFLSRALPLHDAEGRIFRWYGTNTDIEERKRAEEALRESETRFRQLAENISAVFWLTNPAETLLHYISPAYERIWGRSCDSLYAEPSSWMDSVHPDDRARIEEDERLQPTGGRHDHTYRIVRPDGSLRWIRGRAFPVRDEAGKLIRVAGLAEDITERKEAEDRLLEYEKVVEGLEEMIVVVDRNYRYLLANQAFLKYRGIEREQLVGRLVTEVLNEGVFENVTKRKLDECLQGKPVQYEITYRYPDRGERDLLISYFPIEGPAGVDRVACVLQDVTERNRAAKEFEEANDQLRFLSRRLFEVQEEERRHLARELHDEIGQALTAAKINLQSVTGNGGSATVARVEETIAILDRLLGQVRQISLDLRPSMLDDLGLLPALRSLVDQQGRRASVEMRFSAGTFPENLDAAIQTTCFRIAQEAITNALRHAHATRIDVNLCCEGENLRLVIRDNGAGFDAELAQAQTIGLGLIGIKERAALVGGRARISSSPDKGTTIEVSMPLTIRPEHVGRDPGK
jgi:PAS domain S-box-containing protein